jgi:ABC-2 type transport system ATP-binding protein
MDNGQRTAAGEVVLKTIGLTKRFDKIIAVDGLNVEVRAGEVLGFLGPNGSGKSTTVGMILSLISPTSGYVELFGKDLTKQREAIRRRVGAIIETPAFYPYLSGRDNLRALAKAAGGVPETRIEDLLSLVGLKERAGGKFKTYSLGMKQRLGIASTLLTDPALVILDEPTNGLDPAGQREVRSIIPRLASEGRAVLLASHLLNDVEQVCDRVVIIRRGKMIEQGRVGDLVSRSGHLDIEVRPDEVETALQTLRALPGVVNVAVGKSGRHLTMLTETEGRLINRALAERGIYATAIVPRRGSLEQIFLELTEDRSGMSEAGSQKAIVEVE